MLKLDEEEGDRIFFVHYTGWNVRYEIIHHEQPTRLLKPKLSLYIDRYDEWVKRHRVVENLTQRTIGKRTRMTSGNKVSFR